jgi:hypothetical protein
MSGQDTDLFRQWATEQRNYFTHDPPQPPEVLVRVHVLDVPDEVPCFDGEEWGKLYTRKGRWPTKGALPVAYAGHLGDNPDLVWRVFIADRHLPLREGDHETGDPVGIGLPPYYVFLQQETFSSIQRRTEPTVRYFFGVAPGSASGHFLYLTLEQQPGEAVIILAPRGSVHTPWGNVDDPISKGKATDAAWGARPFPGWQGRVEPEGIAHCQCAEGWTLLALWDRSADKRDGCCALFAFNVEVDRYAALALTRKWFPRVTQRIETHLGRPIQFCPLSDEVVRLVGAGVLDAHDPVKAAYDIARAHCSDPGGDRPASPPAAWLRVFFELESLMYARRF